MPGKEPEKDMDVLRQAQELFCLNELVQVSLS